MIQNLISLPSQAARFFQDSDLTAFTGALPKTFRDPSTYIGNDPDGIKLGSGGGTAHLLIEAWRRDKKTESLSFDQWLEKSTKVILHSGGKSKRLPAYSSVGKALIPIPLREETTFGKFQQTLSDLQLPSFQSCLEMNESNTPRALLASGDVWLDFNSFNIPPIKRDLTGVGMRVSAKMATHFGVFVVKKNSLNQKIKELPIEKFLQKPSEAEILSLGDEFAFFVDTGLWFMSQPMISHLLDRCGWDKIEEAFTKTGKGHPTYLDFYADLCLEIGDDKSKLAKAKLTTGVIPLYDAHFYHLGTSRQLFESLRELQSDRSRERKNAYNSFSPIASPKGIDVEHPIWMDGVFLESLPKLEGHNILTTIPHGFVLPNFKSGECLDCTPINEDAWAIRPYHIDDSFQGTIKNGTICGQPALKWLEKRQIQIDSNTEIFEACIYPLLKTESSNSSLISWFFSDSPDPEITKLINTLPKVSSAQLAETFNAKRYFELKEEGAVQSLKGIFDRLKKSYDPSIFQFDFNQLAKLYQNHPELKSTFDPSQEIAQITNPLHESRWQFFCQNINSKQYNQNPYETLRRQILNQNQHDNLKLNIAIKEDQIVWARSPIRLDLAGGWTDTPPYCMENGGAVINVAVTLNGQTPIQVFVRRRSDNNIRIRSIDLGTSEEINSYADILNFDDPKEPFSLPKACLAAIGFHPDFQQSTELHSHSTLPNLLESIGGGIELTLLCAIPKGSGLGTSSILAATITQALFRTFGVDADPLRVYRFVLTIEQLMTTGGGWQDQAGALWGGLKLIETTADESQVPTIRHLPARIFNNPSLKPRMLLYYTGITRMAKDILAEIVAGMFLRDSDVYFRLSQIKKNAKVLFEAIQLDDIEQIEACIRRSWKLNCALDPDTTNPQVDSILKTCQPYLSASKLLGAGGGGYLLMIAKSNEDAHAIQRELNQNPPNPRARFVSIELAAEGIQVSVS